MPKTYQEAMEALWELFGSCDEGVEALEALQAAHEAEVDAAYDNGHEAGYAMARADYCYSYTS